MTDVKTDPASLRALVDELEATWSTQQSTKLDAARTLRALAAEKEAPPATPQAVLDAMLDAMLDAAAHGMGMVRIAPADFLAPVEEAPLAEALVERVALAISKPFADDAGGCFSDGDLCDDTGDTTTCGCRRLTRLAALAALSAIRPGDRLPGGLVAVTAYDDLVRRLDEVTAERDRWKADYVVMAGLLAALDRAAMGDEPRAKEAEAERDALRAACVMARETLRPFAEGGAVEDTAPGTGALHLIFVDGVTLRDCRAARTALVTLDAVLGEGPQE